MKNSTNPPFEIISEEDELIFEFLKSGDAARLLSYCRIEGENPEELHYYTEGEIATERTARVCRRLLNAPMRPGIILAPLPVFLDAFTDPVAPK